MERINVKQLQDIEINGEKVSIKEAFEGMGEFAETISGAVDDMNTKVNTLEGEVEDFDTDKVSKERLDEFNPDDSAEEGMLERWAGGVEWTLDNIDGALTNLGNTINNLPQTYATKAQLADYVANQRLNEFNPDDTATDGKLEKWAGGVNWQIDNLDGNKLGRPLSANNGDVLTYNGSEWVAQAPSGGSGLPEVTPEDAYAYIKVDSNGDFVIQQPLNMENNYGDEEFTGDLKNVPNAEIVRQLIQDSCNSVYSSMEWQIEDLSNNVDSRVNGLSAKLDAQFEYKVQEGNTVTDTVTTRNMVPVPVTVNVDTSLISRGDVVCIYYPNKGASDFIKVTDYGVTPPSKGNVYPADVGADNPEKTIITISVNAPRLEDYPIPVEVTVYQVEKKQLDANTFSNVVDAFNQ